MSYEAVVFDWEMTLVDSEKALEYFRENFFKKLGIVSKIKAKDLLSMTLNELIERLKKEHPKELEKHDKKEMKAMAKSIIEDSMDMFEFKGDIIKKIKGVKIGIISNNSMEIIDMFVKKFGLDFDFMITDEDSTKDKKEELMYALKTLNVKSEEMLYITHNPDDLKSANSLGIATCALITRYHNEEELKKQKPTYVIENIEEVINLI